MHVVTRHLKHKIDIVLIQNYAEHSKFESKTTNKRVCYVTELQHTCLLYNLYLLIIILIINFI